MSVDLNSLYQIIDDQKAEIERLKVELNCATNNLWGEWELDRGQVMGENLSQKFKIAELEQERDSLRTKLERVREWGKCLPAIYFYSLQEIIKDE